MARLSSLFSVKQKKEFLKNRGYELLSYDVWFELTNGERVETTIQIAVLDDIPELIIKNRESCYVNQIAGVDEVFEREMEHKLLFE